MVANLNESNYFLSLFYLSYAAFLLWLIIDSYEDSFYLFNFFFANSLMTTKADEPPAIAANCTALASTETNGATVNAPIKASTNVQIVFSRITLYSSFILLSFLTLICSLYSLV